MKSSILGLRPSNVLALALIFQVATAPFQMAYAQGAKKTERPRTVREELPAEARKDWDAARDLIDAQDYQGALVEYLRAYEISKNPRVLFNVGICEKSLRRYARASARWKQELAEGTGKLTAQEIQELKDAIQALEQFVSTVDVKSNEAGATLYIDNEEAGQTPFVAPIPLDVGPHTLRLHKDTFADQTQTVTISGGIPAKANFVLEPVIKKSRVTVAVTGAPSATIAIDGIEMGPAPFAGELAAGRHTFEARSAGYLPARQTTEVVYKTPLDVTLALAVERHEGRVRVETLPAGALIEIDGKVVGTNSWEGVLPSGGHQLIVKKIGYQSYATEISLSDDQIRNVKATLIEEKTSNWLVWTIGTVAVVGGGAIASYFIFKPADPQPVAGTFDPGIVTTSIRSLHR